MPLGPSSQTLWDTNTWPYPAEVTPLGKASREEAHTFLWFGARDILPATPQGWRRAGDCFVRLGHAVPWPGLASWHRAHAGNGV